MSEHSNNFLISYLKLKRRIRDLIVGNIVISIRDSTTGRELWRCSEGDWKDKKFKNLNVIQDFEVEDFLSELLPLLRQVEKLLKK